MEPICCIKNIKISLIIGFYQQDFNGGRKNRAGGSVLVTKNLGGKLHNTKIIAELGQNVDLSDSCSTREDNYASFTICY